MSAPPLSSAEGGDLAGRRLQQAGSTGGTIAILIIVFAVFFIFWYAECCHVHSSWSWDSL
jgi:hypothetical protein